MVISIEEAIKRGWLPESEKPKTTSKKTPGRSKKEIEGDEQAELIRIFELQFPEYAGLLIHIPNGGSRKNAYEGWRLKQQGVRAGVSDLFLPVARGSYFGLWIEFKATPPFDAEVSDKQLAWISEMQKQGYKALVCLGLTAAFEALKAYLKEKPTVPA